MTFSFRPLSLAEAHRRRAMRAERPEQFWVPNGVQSTPFGTENEDDAREVLP